MNKYILFSPIGSTDPVRDDYDGPMLHIVRHYLPSKVYLFYTEEMRKKKEKIKEALADFEIEIEEIVTDIDAPHDFDIFAKTFDPLLNMIQGKNPDSKILVNISSGTPQMKSALCLEIVSSNLKLKAIQVSTPIKASNENIAHGGSIDDNLDSIMEDGKYISPNRCIESNILTFRRASVKRDIISLIEHYEYRPAYEKLKEELDLFNQDALELIEYANLRQNDNRLYKKSYWNKEFNYTKDFKAELACEYYCILSNKGKTNELSYFILLLKPLAEYLAKDMLGDIDEAKASSILNDYYLEKSGRSYSPLYSFEGGKRTITYNLEHYIALLKNKGIDENYLNSFIELNKQLGSRNILAHDLYREFEIEPNTSLKLLKQLIMKNYGNKVKESSFRVYDLINEKIKELL